MGDALHSQKFSPVHFEIVKDRNKATSIYVNNTNIYPSINKALYFIGHRHCKKKKKTLKKTKNCSYDNFSGITKICASHFTFIFDYWGINEVIAGYFFCLRSLRSSWTAFRKEDTSDEYSDVSLFALLG